MSAKVSCEGKKGCPLCLDRDRAKDARSRRTVLQQALYELLVDALRVSRILVYPRLRGERIRFKLWVQGRVRLMA